MTYSWSLSGNYDHVEYKTIKKCKGLRAFNCHLSDIHFSQEIQPSEGGPIRQLLIEPKNYWTLFYIFSK